MRDFVCGLKYWWGFLDWTNSRLIRVHAGCRKTWKQTGVSSLFYFEMTFSSCGRFNALFRTLYIMNMNVFRIKVRTSANESSKDHFSMAIINKQTVFYEIQADIFICTPHHALLILLTFRTPTLTFDPHPCVDAGAAPLMEDISPVSARRQPIGRYSDGSDQWTGRSHLKGKEPGLQWPIRWRSIENAATFGTAH